MTRHAQGFGFRFALVLSVSFSCILGACAESSFGGSTPGTAPNPSAGAQPDSGNATGTTATPAKALVAAAPVTPAPAPAPAPTTATTTTTTTTSIPSASPSDLPILQQCLAAWQNNPFHGVISNYKKLVAETSYGSFGPIINDQTTTSTPELILIVAADNVGGVPDYDLLNPNGYYCFESNTDVGAVLTINLACTAHIAGPDFKQDTGSVGSNGAAAVTGSNTGSIVTLNYVNPSGGSCP